MKKIPIPLEILEKYLPENELVKFTEAAGVKREIHKKYMRNWREIHGNGCEIHKTDCEIHGDSCEIHSDKNGENSSKTAILGENPVNFTGVRGEGGLFNNVTSTRNDTVTYSSLNINIKEKINKKEKKCEIHKTELEKNFETFWAEYPNKKKKPDAFKAFRRAFARHKGLTVETLANAVRGQKNSLKWQKNNGQYIEHPSTWLNNDCWLDEAIPNRGNPKPGPEGSAVAWHPPKQPVHKPLPPEELARHFREFSNPVGE